MNKEYLSILTEVKLFNGIDTSALGAMLACLGTNFKTFDKGEYIFTVGSKVENIGIVIDGNIKITKEDVFGRQTIIESLGKTHLFGEVLACAGGEKSPVSVVAASKTVVCFIDFSRVATSCKNSCAFHAQLIRNMLGLLAQKNITLNKKLDYLTLKGMREKLSKYLLDLYESHKSANFTIPFNREELADYLSVDRSAMSRELCRMRDEGIINFEKNRFEITNIQGLM